MLGGVLVQKVAPGYFALLYGGADTYVRIHSGTFTATELTLQDDAETLSEFNNTEAFHFFSTGMGLTFDYSTGVYIRSFVVEEALSAPGFYTGTTNPGVTQLCPIYLSAWLRLTDLL